MLTVAFIAGAATGMALLIGLVAMVAKYGPPPDIGPWR